MVFNYSLAIINIPNVLMNLNTRGHKRVFLSQGPFMERTLQLRKPASRGAV